MDKQPFFSIGITTYNRNELLQQCLNSILCQSFGDFEIIVGNDYQKEPITGELLGITDERIRYVNYEKNLGEFANLNKLLDLSCGRYFTWLADDDLLLPEYFKYYFRALKENDYPCCAFGKFQFKQGVQTDNSESIQHEYSCRIFSGREFLRKALARKIWPIATMGIFERGYLQKNGGFQNVTRQDQIPGLYGEYMLLIKAGSLDIVPFIDVPVSQFRIHEESWSSSNSDGNLIKKANQNFFSAAAGQLKQPELLEDFSKNIRQIIEICLYNLGISMLRAKKGIITIIKSLAGSYSDFSSKDNLKIPFLKAFFRISINMIWAKLKK